MSNITNSSPVVTEDKLKDFYEDIKPFLGCPAYLTSEGTSDYYSTEEKVVGRWIDGKPVYQKTYVGTFDTISSSGTTITVGNIPSIQRAIYAYGYSYGTYISSSNTTSFIKAMMNGTNLQISTNNTGLSNKDYYITIQYVKSADSASTTIQEDPNEYSTDEKIIGKWIDGKPIYQRTWNGSFALGTSAVVIDSIQVTGVGTMIDAELVSDDGNAGNRYAFAFKECGWTSQGKLRLSISSGSYTMTSITVRYTKTTDV